MYQGIVVVRLFLVRPREIRRAFAPQRPIVRAPIRRRGGGGARRRPRARARREGARREDADGVAHRRARRRSRGRHRARAVYRTREARGGVRTRHRVAKWRFAFFRGADDAGASETMRVFDALDWIQRAAGKQYVEFYRYYVSKSPPVATRAVAWTTRAPLCASESLSVSLL